ncbi:MAG: O-antigen ligase family protein [Fibrobacteria bacterium]
MLRPLRFTFVILILLPFHILLMVFLFGFLGLPAGVVRTLASWKEGAVCFLILAILFGMVLDGKKVFYAEAADLFAMAFLLQIFVYVIIAPYLGSEVQIVGRLYGLRDSGMLFACYFLGRAIAPSFDELERLLKWILIVGGITSALGLAEWIFLPQKFWVALGVANYFSDFLGVDFTGGDARGQGLPANFWTQMGSLGYVRRSVSVYMSSQGFAVSFLVIIPVSVYFLLYKTEQNRRNVAMVLLNSAALLATITRTSIIACVLGFFAMAHFGRKSLWLKRGYLGILAIAILGVVFSSGVRMLIVQTLTWKSDSSVTHLNSWSHSLPKIMTAPILGHGLSEAGVNGVRFGGHGVGEESVYLRMLGETGAVGFILFFGFWIANMLGQNLIRIKGERRGIVNGLSSLSIAICICYLFNCISADITTSTYTNFSIGILLGMLRTVGDRELQTAEAKGIVAQHA